MMSETSTASMSCEPVVQPGPVSSISASPSTSTDGNFTVSWSAAANMVTSGFNAWGYELKEFKSGVLTQTLTVSPTLTSYNFTDKSNGSYQYQVRGCNLNQGVPICGTSSSLSNTVTVTLTVGTPSSISGPASVDSDGAYTISWGSSSTPSVTYKLEERFKAYGSTTYQSWAEIHSGA